MFINEGKQNVFDENVDDIDLTGMDVMEVSSDLVDALDVRMKELSAQVKKLRNAVKSKNSKQVFDLLGLMYYGDFDDAKVRDMADWVRMSYGLWRSKVR